MLGSVTLFTVFSILASMLAVIRRHVCDSIFGKLEILIRNEVPATCKTSFPEIMNLLRSHLGRFELRDVQTCVFSNP